MPAHRRYRQTHILMVLCGHSMLDLCLRLLLGVVAPMSAVPVLAVVAEPDAGSFLLYSQGGGGDGGTVGG